MTYTGPPWWLAAAFAVFLLCAGAGILVLAGAAWHFLREDDEDEDGSDGPAA